MPNVLDRLTRSAMLLRGYRVVSHPVPGGELAGLEWRSGRSGLPMVVLHGWGSAGVHHALAVRGARHRVSRLLLPDLLGHGFSSCPERLTRESIERGLDSMLTTWSEEPLLLVASSLGGLAAVRFALRHPGRVKALFLVSPFGAPMSDHSLQALVDLVRAEQLSDVKQFLDRLAPRPQLRNWLFAPEMRRIFRRPALQSLLDSTTPDVLLSERERDELRVPVTLVWGKREALFDSDQLAFWARLPRVDVLRPERSGHAPSVDQPFWFERTLRAFIRLHSNTGVDLPGIGMQRFDTALGSA